MISMSAPLVVTATQKQFAETLKAHINANVKMVMKVMAKEFARKFQTKNHAKKKHPHPDEPTITDDRQVLARESR